MFSRVFCVAAFLAASCLSAFAQTPAPTTPAAGPNAPFAMPPADWLLVQTATSVSYDGKILTLKGIAPGTIMLATAQLAKQSSHAVRILPWATNDLVIA